VHHSSLCALAGFSGHPWAPDKGFAACQDYAVAIVNAQTRVEDETVVDADVNAGGRVGCAAEDVESGEVCLGVFGGFWTARASEEV